MDVQVQKMETVITIADEETADTQDTLKENDSFIFCRICFDETKKEKLVSPCYCVGTHGMVHASCLEHWLNVSKRTSCDICHYEFKTIERPLTILECFREKNKFRDFCRDFSTCTLVVCAWTAIVLLCVSKTVRTFADTDHPNSVSDGLSMALVSIIVIIVLCWWLMLFQSAAAMWWGTKTITRLDNSEV